MKNTFKQLKQLFGCCLVFASFSCVSVGTSQAAPVSDISESKQKSNQEAVEYANDTYSRTGEIPLKELITRYKKFADNYRKYQPEAEELKLFSRLDGFELVVFFGLWCHDSQREIPRLLKLIDQSNTYFKSIKLIALDTDKVLSEKLISEKLSSRYAVSTTPTIYIIDNRQIVAKVVERPKVSLSQDLVEQIFKTSANSQNKTQTQVRK